jgi:type II secretory pathway pseudopilin PulG
MHTLPATLWSVGRSLCGDALASTATLRRALGQRAPLRAESGMSLIEVVVAALIVGLITVGTLTGFDSAGRASADQRAQAQATVLAQQDEERLRGLPAATLGQFGSSTRLEAENGLCIKEVSAGKWQYYPKGNKENLPFCEAETSFAGEPYVGTVFTVSSSARYVTAPKGATGASFACETAGSSADYIQTTSSVTWSAHSTRAPVTESSIVTSPVSAVVEIVVKNQKSEPVSGATVKLKNEAGTSVIAEQTTGSSGCAIFGAVLQPNVKAFAEKPGWVDKRGKPAAEKEFKVSQIALTKEELVIAEAGTLEVTFESNGTTVGVTGDTFVAAETEIPLKFLVGGTAGAPASKVVLPNLFPFVKPPSPFPAEKYKVYAGDCEANDAKVVGGVAYKEEAVEPGKTTQVKAEVPKVNVLVMSGAKAGEGGSVALKGATVALFINKECAAKNSQNLAPVPTEHKATVTESGAEEGHVVAYMPYAKELKLCVVSKLIGTKYLKKTFAVINTKKEGVAVTKYMKEGGTGKAEEESTTPEKCP